MYLFALARYCVLSGSHIRQTHLQQKIRCLVHILWQIYTTKFSALAIWYTYVCANTKQASQIMQNWSVMGKKVLFDWSQNGLSQSLIDLAYITSDSKRSTKSPYPICQSLLARVKNPESVPMPTLNIKVSVKFLPNFVAIIIHSSTAHAKNGHLDLTSLLLQLFLLPPLEANAANAVGSQLSRFCILAK